MSLETNKHTDETNVILVAVSFIHSGLVNPQVLAIIKPYAQCHVVLCTT